MNAMKLAAIGSCVTRDVWPICGDLPRPFLFLARTSFPSMLSPMHAPIEYDRFDFDGNWPRHCVQRDNEGLIPGELVAYNPTTLVLDFVDERYDLLNIGDKYLLKTVELMKSGALELPWAQNARTIVRETDECMALWKDGVSKFVSFMREHLPRTKVILHRAPWTSRMVNAADVGAEVTAAPATQHVTHGKSVSVVQFDALMNSMYDAFQAAMPEVVPITVDPAFHISATGHQWKRAAFHYVKSYYRDFFRQLQTHWV